MDQDQNAPVEQSDLGPHCLSLRVDEKNIHFVIMRFLGLINVSSVCLR